jgi:RNA polymerase sigma factor (sigma-70 family)
LDAAQLERVYRTEAARITAALAARIGDVGLAADAVQDAFIEAIEHWKDGEIPPNCGGWLATTARRKAIDRLRRARAGQDKLALLAATTTDSFQPAEDADDELLGMIFACCHPVLPRESQIALTLRAVCGLTTQEIAAAFLVSEPAMTQRLLRARKALRAAHADLRIPDPDDLADRLAEVLAVVYLVFNEGYLASAGRQPARRDLAAQAVALARLLHRLMPREPEVLGLLALMLLHESRAATRFDGWGRLVRLADQDRTRWNRPLIAEATGLLDRALTMRTPGPYQVQAAIAALHAEAPDYEHTDWRQIRLLYDRLQALTPSPVVLLNRAVATRYVVGPEAALAEITPLAAELDSYRLFHALRAGLLAGLGRDDEARAASERALALASNPAERELLARRLSFLRSRQLPPQLSAARVTSQPRAGPRPSSSPCPPRARSSRSRRPPRGCRCPGPSTRRAPPWSP